MELYQDNNMVDHRSCIIPAYIVFIFNAHEVPSSSLFVNAKQFYFAEAQPSAL